MFIEAFVGAFIGGALANGNNNDYTYYSSLNNKLDKVNDSITTLSDTVNVFFKKYEWDSFLNLMHIKGAKYENNKLTLVENDVLTVVDLISKDVIESTPATNPTNTYRRCLDGKEYINGRKIHDKGFDGTERWYNTDGRVIKMLGTKWGTRKFEITYTYDSNGKVIHSREVDNGIYVRDRYYDSYGDCIHITNGTWYGVDSEWWYDYDSNGKLVHSRSSYGNDTWFDPDKETDGERTEIKKGLFNFITHNYEKKIETLRTTIRTNRGDN